VRFLSLVTAVIVAVLMFPSAARADSSGLMPLRAGTADIRPGQNIPLELGVKNTDKQTVDGLVVNIRVDAGFDLPRSFTNCRYYTDGNLEGAWCALSGSVGGGKAYTLGNFHVAAAAHAQRLGPIVFQWYSATWAESQGGLGALAGGNAGDGQTSIAGTGDTLTLTTASSTSKTVSSPVGTAYLRLITSTATPRAPLPSRAPSTSSTARSSSKPGGIALRLRSEDGGMSIGAMLALAAGIVAVLLALGWFLLRRRRS
jgi:hypothetical protein